MDPRWFEWPAEPELQVRPAFQWRNLRVWLITVAAAAVIPLMVVAALLSQQ